MPQSLSEHPWCSSRAPHAMWLSLDETVCHKHAQMSERYLLNNAFLNYIDLWVCISDNRDFWLYKMTWHCHATQMHPYCQFFGYMHACMLLSASINTFKHAKIHSADSPCEIAVLQTAHNLWTWHQVQHNYLASDGAHRVSSCGFYSM